ncbi:MAG: hypothetical protein IKK80_02240 [Treponema sp.]|nr:hypothetical protein [Treponema sp.]
MTEQEKPLDNEDIEILTYNFTKREVYILAKFLRKKEEELPLGLENFCKTLEDSVYNSLSIQEVRRFYS